jgi:hypothetical protein
MLNTALDVSAGTGMDLASATKILSQAYVGNYKGLKQLNLGYTNAELATKSYLEIEKLIAEQYAGQSKNAADSYQGSLNKLKIAAEQASEQIGQSLVSALSTSSGGMDKLIDKVDGAADSISWLITNVAVLSKDLKDLFSNIPGAGVLDNISRAVQNRLGKLSIGNLRNQVDKLLGRQGGFPQGVPADIKNLQSNMEKTKMDKEALKRQKELIALQKKAQLAEKNKLSLSKAAAVFDTTRISIAAALQATYDKETRLRLEALMAIENEQGDLALRKINELAAFQKNADLQKLAGITTIGDAALQELNTRLLTELKVINDSKMAEGDKELAREEAFKKYNAALVAAGGLAEKNSYDERTQIQLTEVARLAALSKTTSATLTLNKIRESEEIDLIDRVAKAQKAADDARLKALQDYIALLGKVGPSGSPSAPSTTPGKPTGPAATIMSFKTKEAEDAITIFGKTITETFQKVEDSTAFNALVQNYMGGNINPFNSGQFKLNEDTAYSQLTTTGAYDKNYNITVNAGVVGSEEVIVGAVQNAILTLNRRGDSLAVAGTL